MGARDPSSSRPSAGALSRRDVVRLGALAGAAVVAPPLGAPRVLAQHHGHPAPLPGPHPGGHVAPFSVPFRVPPVLAPVRRDATTDYYDIPIRAAGAEILPGRTTTIWGYAGQFPGPTIHARRGRRVVVAQRNQLRVPMAVHLHGAKVSPGNDGHPSDLIAPGASRLYHYPNLQPAATLWYHDHVHHHTSRNVYMGLAGLYLLHDPAEARLGLPAGPFDLPLVLQDRSFRPDGSFAFRDDHFAVVGHTILVNGRPQPFLGVAARRYRLRLVNASNHRHYRLRLSSGRPLIQIASDGGLLPAPHRTAEIELWPGERAEAIVDFSGLAAGSSVVLENAAGSGPTTQVMRFDVGGPAPDPSRVPARLARLPRLTGARTTRTTVLGMDAARGVWVLNGRSFDAERVDVRVPRGRTEIWRLVNRSSMAHPMHFHNQQFQVLDRNGRPPGPGERGWKDTVRVGAGETVRLLTRFERHLGRYVYHCHSLPHEDHEMMAQLEVVR